FGIVADVDLNLMRPNQSLAGLTSRCLEGLDQTIKRFSPDSIVAQGDTTSVLCSSMAAFYHRIPFVHVEAGLRTHDLRAPWPEEFNRRVASLVAALHCAPTQRAADNLMAEGVDTTQIHITGNTVIDALLWTATRERLCDTWAIKHEYLGDRCMVLITGHRRESFGGGFESICQAIRELAQRFPETSFLYPVHLNPNVREPVFRLLAGHQNIHLTDPVKYPEFVWLMDRATVILTDSGGVQEEAPSLGKPILVMRETTERPEAIEAGAGQLVGTSCETIVSATTMLLTDPIEYAKRQLDTNPYGDGHAAQRIVDLMHSHIKPIPLAA
ncbi:MAG: UDP-N-acetylglucosamine 2-epimerase (non-hydrolyzing), partial [Planctomycetes bacterium]|nr:UDP-N-acetylglucosamine 2-epimerase (non-hydrolyzing) [Planctomycetota bacterium]